MMKNHRVESIRGYSIPQLQELLTESTSELPTQMKIHDTALGGWTNINLLLETADSQFVLKIPALVEEYERNPYTYVVHVSSQISKNGLCPRPITMGRLADSQETPFTIFEYVEGTTISSKSEYISVETHIGQVLLAFSKLRPDRIRTFSTALEYHQRLLTELEEFAEQLKPKNSNLQMTLDSFLEKSETITSHLISLTTWTRQLMHGDLRLDNIVITNDGPVLLDLENCALGEPIFDLVYMKMESADETFEDNSLDNFPEVPESDVRTLTALALLPVIAWTLKRLIHLDEDLIEPSLSSDIIRTKMDDYLLLKMKELNIRLSMLNG